MGPLRFLMRKGVVSTQAVTTLESTRLIGTKGFDDHEKKRETEIVIKKYDAFLAYVKIFARNLAQTDVSLHALL